MSTLTTSRARSSSGSSISSHSPLDPPLVTSHSFDGDFSSPSHPPDPIAANAQLSLFSSYIHAFSLSVPNSPSPPTFDPPAHALLQDARLLLPRITAALASSPAEPLPLSALAPFLPDDASSGSCDFEPTPPTSDPDVAASFAQHSPSPAARPSRQLAALVWRACSALLEIAISLSVYFARYPECYERSLVDMSLRLRDAALFDVLQALHSHASPQLQSSSLLTETLLRQNHRESLHATIAAAPQALDALISVASCYLDRISVLPSSLGHGAEETPLSSQESHHLKHNHTINNNMNINNINHNNQTKNAMTMNQIHFNSQPELNQQSQQSKRASHLLTHSQSHHAAIQLSPFNPPSSPHQLHSSPSSPSSPSSSSSSHHPSSVPFPIPSRVSQGSIALSGSPDFPRQPRVIPSAKNSEVVKLIDDVRKYMLSSPSGLSKAEFSTSLESMCHRGIFSSAHQPEALKLAKSATDAINNLSLVVAKSPLAAKYADLLTRASQIQNCATFHIDPSLCIGDELDSTAADPLSVSIRSCRLNTPEIAGQYAAVLRDLLFAIESIHRQVLQHHSARPTSSTSSSSSSSAYFSSSSSSTSSSSYSSASSNFPQESPKKSLRSTFSRRQVAPPPPAQTTHVVFEDTDDSLLLDLASAADAMPLSPATPRGGSSEGRQQQGGEGGAGEKKAGKQVMQRSQSTVLSRGILLYKLAAPTGLPTRDRKLHRKVFRHTFLGTEFVEWCIENLAYIPTRDKATALGGSLLEEGYLECLTERKLLVMKDKKSAIYCTTEQCHEVYLRTLRSQSTADTSVNLLASPFKMSEIILRILESGVHGPGALVVKDRAHKFKTIRSCFLAGELITWLSGNVRGLAIRSEAISFCKLLAKHRFITSALSAAHHLHQEFEDRNELWIFTDGSSSRRPLIEAVSKDGHVTPTSHLALFILKYEKERETTTFLEMELPGETHMRKQPGKELPSILEASPEVLFSRLLNAKVFDAEFQDCYMVSFRLWMSPRDLLGLLIQEFKNNMVMDASLSLSEDESHESQEDKTEIELSAVQTRILNIFKQWIPRYFEDFDSSPEMISVLSTFLDSIRQSVASRPDHLALVDSVLNLFRSAQQQAADLNDIAESLASLQSSTDKLNPTEILNFSASDLAAQITLLFFLRYRKLDIQDCMSGTLAELPAFRSITKIFNSISEVVTGSILNIIDLSHRKRVTELWISVCHNLFKIGNFLGALSVHTALNSFHIRRLAQTWSGLSEYTKEHWQSLSDILSHRSNFGLLRYHQNQTKPPYIPYIGIFMRDLLSVREKFTAPLVEEPNPPLTFSTLVHFGQCSLLAPIVKNIVAGRFSDYRIEVHQPVQQFILRLYSLKIADQDVAEKLSVNLEVPEDSLQSYVERLNVTTLDLQAQIIQQSNQIQSLREENAVLKQQMQSLIDAINSNQHVSFATPIALASELHQKVVGSGIRPIRDRGRLTMPQSDANMVVSSLSGKQRTQRTRTGARLLSGTSSSPGILADHSVDSTESPESERKLLLLPPMDLLTQLPTSSSSSGNSSVSANANCIPSAATRTAHAMSNTRVLDSPKLIRVKLDDDGLLRQLGLAHTFKTIPIGPTDHAAGIANRLISKIVTPQADGPTRKKIKETLEKWSLALQFAENHGDRWMWLEDDQCPLRLLMQSNPQPQLWFAKPLSVPLLQELGISLLE